MKRDLAEEAVSQVYTELARRPVERDCIGRADCCRFRLTGQVPYVTRGEAMVAAKAWKATGRTRVASPPDGSCPFLDPASARCRIYEGRPLPCRTHFCRPAGGPYPRRKVQDLVWELERIDAELGGNGARPIDEAVRSVMR